jgi:uncharacterized membrane protein YhaH (DUF805 family)
MNIFSKESLNFVCFPQFTSFRGGLRKRKAIALELSETGELKMSKSTKISKPVFDDLFNYREGRRNRKSLILLMGAQLLVSVALVIIIMAVTPHAGEFMRGIIGLCVLAIAVPTIASQFAAMAQRCRDISVPGWMVFANFVPFVSIAFQIFILFYPGTRGPNKYGPDPTGRIALDEPLPE